MAVPVRVDRSARTKANKERYQAKCKKKLEKAKARRLKKYGELPTTELTRHTLSLFIKWGHRALECKSAILNKMFKAVPRKQTGFKGHWG